MAALRSQAYKSSNKHHSLGMTEIVQQLTIIIKNSDITILIVESDIIITSRQVDRKVLISLHTSVVNNDHLHTLEVPCLTTSSKHYWNRCGVNKV